MVSVFQAISLSLYKYPVIIMVKSTLENNLFYKLSNNDPNLQLKEHKFSN